MLPGLVDHNHVQPCTLPHCMSPQPRPTLSHVAGYTARVAVSHTVWLRILRMYVGPGSYNLQSISALQRKCGLQD